MNRLLTVFAHLVERNAKKKVQKRTKKTAGSISVSTPSEMTRAITVHDRAGIMLEFGTGPHLIVAKNALALMLPITPGMSGKKAAAGVSPFGKSFGPQGTARLSGVVRGGQIAFFKSVHHTGTKAYPFMLPGFYEAMAELPALMTVASRQILTSMAGKGELGAVTGI